MATTLISFGEILWDILPSGSRLGGAPYNVAAHAARLGAKAALISAVGSDPLGKKALTEARKNGVDTQFIELHKGPPTGTAQVLIDEGGNASYRFGNSVAWDFIPASHKALEAVAQADVIVFSVLAVRTGFTREAYEEFRNVPGPMKVLDVNLRPPYTPIERVLVLCSDMDLIKANEEEARILTQSTPSAGAEALAWAMASQTGCSRICISTGERGAVFLDNGTLVSAPAPKVKVKDTVGAGDAFLAALLVGLNEGQDSEAALTRACKLGALVASKTGAIPKYKVSDLDGAGK